MGRHHVEGAEMTDELRRLAAAAYPNGISAQVLNAKLAQQTADEAQAGGIATTRPTAPQTQQQAALVTSVAIGAPMQGMTPTSLAQVETESRDAVAEQEAQAFGLTPADAWALAAWRNEQALGVPAGAPGGSVSEAIAGDTADRLDALGLTP